MKTIHKFRVNPGQEATRLRLKEGFRVVRCEYIVSDKAVYLWVEQPLGAAVPETEKYFRVAFSGQPIPDDFEYVDTALDPFGPEAFHVFEVPLEAERREGASGGMDMGTRAVQSSRYRHAGAA